MSWNWIFGDGLGSSTLTNPVYTYNFDGSYITELEIISDKGCYNSLTSKIIINEIKSTENIKKTAYPNMQNTINLLGILISKCLETYTSKELKII